MADDGKNRQDFQPGEAGLVEKWDPVKGRFVTMNELAEEQRARDEFLRMTAECAKADLERHKEAQRKRRGT